MNESLMSKPLVSVIVPVFNSEMYISECIYSITSQSYPNLEIIIVNDGSTDNSSEIIQTLKKKDSRIIVLSQTNKGVSSARNRGIDQASGEYIAFLDSDDLCVPDRIEKQLCYMQSHNLDVCGSSLCIISDNNKEKVKSYPVSNDQLKFNYLFFKKTMAWSSTIFKVASIKNHRFDENLCFAEDFDFLLRLVIGNNVRIGNIPEVLIKYRQHNQQTTKKLANKNRSIITRILFNSIRNELEDNININDIIQHYSLIKEKKTLSQNEFLHYAKLLKNLNVLLRKNNISPNYFRDFIIHFTLQHSYLNRIIKQWLFSHNEWKESGSYETLLTIKLSIFRRRRQLKNLIKKTLLKFKITD